MKRFPRFLLFFAIVCGGLLILSEGDMFVSVTVGLLIGVLTLSFDTKAERKEKAAARKAKDVTIVMVH